MLCNYNSTSSISKQFFKEKGISELTTPDFNAAICGPLEVPPYKQMDSTPQDVPASHITSEICK